MSPVEQDFQNVETLYRALELRLERQYQDLLAHRYNDSDGEAEDAELQRRLLEAEKLLAKSSSLRMVKSVVPATTGPSTVRGAISLRKQAQHLLELVERNVAQCVQLQNAARCGLQELQRGERFLQGVRGYRENQPRFFDSHQ